MQLIVDEYGYGIRKVSERLVIRDRDRKIVQEVPFFDVDDVIIASRGVSISSDVVEHCAEQGIPIHFLSYKGDPFAKLVSPSLQATIATRRAQLEAYKDRRSVVISKVFVGAKIRAQLNLIKYWAKNRRGNSSNLQSLFEETILVLERNLEDLNRLDGAAIDEVRGTLLSIEGRSAYLYWEVVKKLLKPELGFSGRDHRGATDPVNIVLNYGYGCLQNEISKAILLAGLEECAGFLHVDRSGRPSFVLDFMEEFRQPIVDRTVLALFTKGFSPKMEDDGLSKESRRVIAQAITERLESKDRYEGKRYQLKTIIQRQAYHLATFLREGREYKPFVWSW
ncbi:CRISPR-associated endonuclease Cas1 [Effusibacillus lacus]|uniref:CRISPR-associated endonuclease Cas1 n=1 Tax=Effusibacillus lacus TaxID=1348429 RepID=A0A292YIT3_9BACL|nr:CRISPR-associated endonuclease Cas1 [Effusibacillus lacus]TCS67958.1 CRISPR-associated Cas1 family protein [Effusibacillus lacus]GAX88395.1 CRISPR-associated protein Cas1 [Effusibacillus lacus]